MEIEQWRDAQSCNAADVDLQDFFPAMMPRLPNQSTDKLERGESEKSAHSIQPYYLQLSS